MGWITDIQRFSLNDGPGIRTTVFFKGCNARCRWCHNPETLTMEPVVLVYPDRCIHCGSCVGFDVEKAKAGLPPVHDKITPAQAQLCFSGALSVAGREATTEEVLREIRQDKGYYETSGGGVTLSGGEVMMQPEFAGEILEACRAEGISTAIETNLLYDFARLEGLFANLDLVMADIKLMNAEKHRKYVGADNSAVLKNAALLAKSGKSLILRTPVIPGVNDSEEEITAIACWIAENAPGVLYYELLNFNPLGASKYDALRVDNDFRDQKPLTPERMAELQKCAERAGIPVRAG